MMNDPRMMAELEHQIHEQIQKARQAVEQNPRDHANLTKWGECLLELSMLKQGPGDNQEVRKLLIQCQEKLQQSLAIFPENANAMVVLASALNARAFMQPDYDVACTLFDEAKDYFRRAVDLEPENPKYRELLEAMNTAPQLHAQVMQQMAAQNAMAGMGGMGGQQATAAAPPNEDWLYDWLGWGILIVGSLGVLAMLNAKAQNL
mmetsp:Transcript_71204/g.190090  ORF Transcript_71204/g.190090 Transcript_71204/m.190090 type:complete len:205 (-) Transcript_71204:205-819(-)|eukprot:CAMPEP_0113664992 /NCGR_PEP_ID=MMETSP0038_2-20120614/2049_1 /TAXON_ID=2898 /ORGANISM="Cryptomonas paramecium" /LENGTH=204 /DNA_ID=CAMNT_0000580279 /DNA_START=28 /DNA_END=642 /DNA_ORIENTATION=- /assembly_acc=CAM_ASM_000170